MCQPVCQACTTCDLCAAQWPTQWGEIAADADIMGLGNPGDIEYLVLPLAVDVSQCGDLFALAKENNAR